MKKTFIITFVSVVATLGLSYSLVFATNNQVKDETINSQVSEIETLNNSLSALQENVNDLQNKVETNGTTEIFSTPTETTEPQTDIQSQLNLASSQIQQLTNEVDTRNNKLNQLQSTKNALELQLKNAKDGVESWFQQSRDLTAKRNELLSEYNYITTQKIIVTVDPAELQLVKQRKTQLELELQENETKRQEASSSRVSLEKQIPILESQIADLEKQMLGL